MSTHTNSRHPTPRIPLNTFAICFGVAGVATAWSSTSAALRWGPGLATVLWSATAVAWVWLIVAHVRRGWRSNETLASQLRHPAQGPIAAVVPIVGMLLGYQLYGLWPVGGAVLAGAAFLGALLFGGWILAYWHQGSLNQEAFHGGYLLPTVAASFVAAIVTGRLGLMGLAIAAFAIGIFFWLILITVLLSRLAFFPPLPDPLTPTLAILVAPPSLAGTAWFIIDGPRQDPVSVAFLGLLVVMVILQLFLLGTYRRLQFSLGFWSFTFPLAAGSSYAVQWTRLAGFPGWELVCIALATLPTLLTLIVAVRSLMLVTTGRRGARRAEQTLRKADDAVMAPVRARQAGAPPRFDNTAASRITPETRRR